jgi:relaxase-like protein
MPTRTVRVSSQGQPILDIASYGRRGPGRRDRLSPGQVEQIARTVRRVPEVMVKVSGGGTSSKAVAAHFKYIDRHGKLEIEADDGEPLAGKGVEKALIEDWGLESDAAESQSPYTGRPGRKPAKLVHNVILSMPAGTPPDRLFAASRAFVREQFALKHRYAMVLHTDQDHPHVHLVIKAMSDQGERLNIRKATLREWRREFARHLREHGVAANATERAVRGESKTRMTDGIYRATIRGDSTHTRARVEAVASELTHGDFRPESGKSKLLGTRLEIARGWRATSDMLLAEGKVELAAEVKRFADTMPPTQTAKELIAAALRDRTRRPPAKVRPAAR